MFQEQLYLRCVHVVMCKSIDETKQTNQQNDNVRIIKESTRARGAGHHSSTVEPDPDFLCRAPCGAASCSPSFSHIDTWWTERSGRGPSINSSGLNEGTVDRCVVRSCDEDTLMLL